MADNKFKTGEKAPESGEFKVDSLVNSGSGNNDNTTISIEKGEQFPPSPSSNEAAYWVKA
ncbi:YjzC family protein [Oceanobacillus sp. FSL H7-0719]|uniref:YjzC family protein n=1 Tax=Oceanobacillus sp. FSL H7-0719 TaxID=2954507 RepID=UPI003248BCBE